MIVLRPTAGALVLCVAISLGLAGCSKKAPAATPAPPPPTPTAPATPPSPPPPPAPPAAPPATTPLTEEERFKMKSLEELSKELASVYFDLDEATIRDDARPPLQKNAEWLKRWTSTQVTVNGHCDERGTVEYNLALGERRANAVREYLVSLGVPATRINVVSKGKESPFCTEANEACWQQNRAGVFTVTAK